MIGSDNPEMTRQNLDKVSIVVRPGWVAVHQHHGVALALVQIVEPTGGELKVMGVKIVFEQHNPTLLQKINN